MQRLVALVQRPRLQLIRFLGVLAYNAKLSSGGAARGAARAQTGGLGLDALRVRAELRLAPPCVVELGQAAHAGV
ncbi:MAG: hypothetical protein H7228_10730 [Polaromonas sp.]|nr:hypothetical protein [Polaromonas sp.]